MKKKTKSKVRKKKISQKCITCGSTATELDTNNTVCNNCQEYACQSSYTMTFCSSTTFPC